MTPAEVREVATVLIAQGGELHNSKRASSFGEPCPNYVNQNANLVVHKVVSAKAPTASQGLAQSSKFDMVGTLLNAWYRLHKVGPIRRRIDGNFGGPTSFYTLSSERLRHSDLEVENVQSNQFIGFAALAA
jgi:hypothetical protein